MPFYEAMYLVHPSVDDDRLTEIIQRYNQVVESGGGVIEHSGKWDRRRLAYPINKAQEATYVLMYFRADPQVPAELDRLFRISDEVIRHLIIRHDKPHLVLTMPSEEPAEAEEVSEAGDETPVQAEQPDAGEPDQGSVEPTVEAESTPPAEEAVNTAEQQA